jgi:tetratricopeptide (TPR) repeat protein
MQSTQKMDIPVSARRAPAAAALKIAAASLVAIGVLLISGPLRHGAAFGEPSAIGEKAAKLSVRSSTSESTAEKAMRVRAALKTGDYATAHKIVGGVLADSRLQNWRFYPFSDFLDRVTTVNDPALEPHLDAWIAQDPNDPIPLLVRAQYFHDMGWLKRGPNFSREVRPDHMAVFLDYMTRALADVDASLRLSDANPHAFYLKLRILRGAGSGDGMRETFEAAIAKFPSYYPVYDALLTVLQPKWGGTVEDMYAFVDRYAGQATEYSPLKMLYVSLYRALLGTASTACHANWRDRDKMAQCVESNMQKIVTPDLRKRVLAALRLYDHTDRYQFGLALERIVSDMLNTGGGDAYSGAILQLVASSMHGNTQLNQDNPGHNDYMVDKLVAESWHLKKFYDNALKKAQEALDEIEAATFPSKEEKDFAVSGVYRTMAESYNGLRQYPDMIAYHQAAIALGGKTDRGHIICYGYVQLRDYEAAAPACTRAIDDEPGNMSAWYWRARLSRELKQPDAELRDMTVVAESESGFRSGAAIGISVILFNRKDMRGALDALNKYTYLYDPELSDKDDVAVGYNNRCYAYMQLNELRKALDDCTASLKYGSIPEAFRKQEELIKLLGTRDSRL